MCSCLASICRTLEVFHIYIHTHAHTQGLAIAALIAGSVGQNNTDQSLLSGLDLQDRSNAASGWIIFVSIVVMLYEAVVIVTRFCNFGFISKNIQLFLVIVSHRKILSLADCESVVHLLWECPVYGNTFMGELDKLLGVSFEEFSTLDNFRLYFRV